MQEKNYALKEKIVFSTEEFDTELNTSVEIDLKDTNSRADTSAKKLESFDTFKQFSLKETNGNFKFIITLDGEIYIGYDNNSISHNMLCPSKQEKVKAAGIIKFDGQKIAYISNYSGHYKPNSINAYYAMGKLAKKLQLDLHDYEVAVGLHHEAGSFDGYLSPTMAIVHKDENPQHIQWHGYDHFFYEKKGTASSVFKKFDYSTFTSTKNKAYKPFLTTFSLWRLRSDDIYNNLDRSPKLDKKHVACQFIELLGEDPEEIIPRMHQGRMEM